MLMPLWKYLEGSKMKIRVFVAVGAFGCLLASASAQYGYGFQYSETDFYTSVSDPSVSVTYVGGGYYNNGVPAPESGDAYNYNYEGEYPDDYTFAENESYDYGDPGYASQFNGENYLIDFTNTGDVDQTFSVEEYVFEVNENYGNGTSVSYGGIEEYGGSDFFGYNTVGMGSNGVASDDPYNFDNYYFYSYTDFSEAESYGYFSDTLAPGQSIEVQVWSSGSSSVNTSSSVPGPAAAVPFALAAFAARRRRKA
jgi:MYXO-CTERM domain-containing protein